MSTLFIVEDDRDVQYLLKRSLTNAGFKVSVFNDGYPIIENMEELPDLFILDIELPGINGLEICRWIKTHEETEYIPVILLSAAPYLKVLAENVHADDYLEKPVNLAVLIDKINNCMTSNKMFHHS